MDIKELAALAQSSQSMMGRRIVRSAMTPIVLLCAVSPFCFLAAYSFKDDVFVSYLLAIIGALPIVIACGAYVYFALYKTDKLQSEDYQVKQELLQMVWKKAGKLHVEPISLDAVANPDPMRLEGGREGDK